MGGAPRSPLLGVQLAVDHHVGQPVQLQRAAVGKLAQPVGGARRHAHDLRAAVQREAEDAGWKRTKDLQRLQLRHLQPGAAARTLESLASPSASRAPPTCDTTEISSVWTGSKHNISGKTSIFFKGNNMLEKYLE